MHRQIQKALVEGALILVLAICLSLGAFHFRPASQPSSKGINTGPRNAAQAALPETLDVKEALGLHSSVGVIFLDARDREIFEFERIKGALNLPLAEFDRHIPTVAEQLRSARL